MTGMHMYAISFCDGTVKVGITSSVRTRWRLICREKSASPVSFISSPRIDTAPFRAEQFAMSAMSKAHNTDKRSREWFLCNDFGYACNVVRQAYQRFGDRVTGWKIYKNISPLTKRDSGWRQKADKKGRWASA